MLLPTVPQTNTGARVYGWKVAGIFQNQQEIDALNAQSPTGKYQDGDTAPGDFK